MGFGILLFRNNDDPFIGNHMTTTKYAAQRRRLEKEIQRLQKQAAALEQKQRMPVITGLIRTMREYDITPEDIATAYNSKRRGPAKRAAKTATGRSPVPPKYRDPESGATWSGRGKAPRWVTEAEQQGKSRDSFLIDAAK